MPESELIPVRLRTRLQSCSGVWKIQPEITAIKAEKGNLSMLNLRGLTLVLLVGLFSTALFGQNATFTGHVTDSSGALVAKAQVTIHNQETGVNVKTITSGVGDYTVPYLRPGTYTVSAKAEGFKIIVKTDITLQVAQTAVIDFSLQVGDATQTITVKADNALLDRGKADRGEIVENARVTELPLNGRDPDMLSILNAGAVWSGQIKYQRPFDDTMENLSINGGGAGQNELMMDGMSNEVGGTNNHSNSHIAYVAPVDSVQEFKIITNPYDAQYGRAAGGVVDMTLKSGTNKIHGDAYEFARRTFLDANSWQNNWLASTTGNTAEYARAQHKLDQYGAELDGPVVLPKLYSGRDKTFFLLQYENWNEVVPNSMVTSVPSSSWSSGDFSNLTWYNGDDKAYEPIWIYDPLSLDCSSGACIRQTFAAEAGHTGDLTYNKIPSNRLNATAQKIMSYYPAPNTIPAAGTYPFGNNYSTPNPTTDRYRNVIGKIDENLTAADHFSLRYGYYDRVEIDSTNGMPGVIAEGEYPLGQRSHTFATEWTHTFNPNLLFDFRGNVIVRADYSFGGPAGFDPTTLGWSNSLVGQFGSAGGSQFPLIAASEFAQIGNNGNSQTVGNTLALFPTVTWIKGKHTIHGGIDARFMQSINNVIPGGPYFYVDRQWTQSNYIDGDWTEDSGNSFASMLLGTMTSGGVTINTHVFWSQHYWAPFVQDDWRVTRRLTLNLGVRWDFNPSAVDRHDRGDYAFNTTDVNPVDPQVNHALMPNREQVIGGVTFLGVNGNPRATYALTKANIQPRVGFAYSLNNDTVIRGGFGEMFKNPLPGTNTLGYSISTNYNATLDGGKTPYATIDNPYPSGILQPPGSSLGLQTDLGQGPAFLNPKYKVPSYWSYSFGMEHNFTKYDTMDVSYVGSRTYNQDSSDNINHENVASYIPCNLDMGGNPTSCDNDYPGNPFQNVAAFQGSGYYSAPTIQAVNLTRPFPAFGDIIEYQLNDMRSWFNSLQVTGVHKWSNSLTLHGTWTWSKLMDAGSWTDEMYRVRSRYLDGGDRTHRITLSGVYIMPFGRGRSFFGGANRIVDAFIGGWELGSLYVYETGWPWATSYHYLHNAWVPRHIEKSTGYIRGVAACAQEWQRDNSGAWSLNKLAYNYEGTCAQTDFSAVPEYGETTNTIYTGIRVPSNHQFDANFSKNFAIVEGIKLQMRWEAFNVLNHPLWQESYQSTIQDTNFGTIEKGPSGQSNLARQMQIALKLIW